MQGIVVDVVLVLDVAVVEVVVGGRLVDVVGGAVVEVVVDAPGGVTVRRKPPWAPL